MFDSVHMGFQPYGFYKEAANSGSGPAIGPAMTVGGFYNNKVDLQGPTPAAINAKFPYNNE